MEGIDFAGRWLERPEALAHSTGAPDGDCSAEDQADRLKVPLSAVS